MKDGQKNMASGGKQSVDTICNKYSVAVKNFVTCKKLNKYFHLSCVIKMKCMFVDDDNNIVYYRNLTSSCELCEEYSKEIENLKWKIFKMNEVQLEKSLVERSYNESTAGQIIGLNNHETGDCSKGYIDEVKTQLTDKTTIKVYARCLRPDIEYKTLSITFQTTCREVVSTLLGKYKMKHRDPKLFYLSMEVTVRKAGVRTLLPLDEEARPAVLQSCHPKGDSKFSLQTRRGGLVKVYDSALNCNSQYKSLLISAKTTVDELIALLLTCSNNKERVEQFSLYEVCSIKEQQRKLHPDDRPLQVQQTWLPSLQCHFLIKRNLDYMPLTRRKIFWKSAHSSAKTTTPSMQLSKSHMTLLPLKPQEDTTSTRKTSEKNATQLTTKSSGTPSYADYENYFYI